MTQSLPTLDELLNQLHTLADPAVLQSQQRFGISGANQLGISIYTLRKLARGVHSHDLALGLWNSGLHEARLLAAFVDEPEKATRQQVEEWCSQFDSWDVCDIVTDELFIHTPFILELLPAWAACEEEFVRRAAFASIAALTVHRKDLADEQVAPFFDLITAAATDPRNFVKKAVNWALRNIGKHRPALRPRARALAQQLAASDDKTARWIGKDALKEFQAKFDTATGEL